MIFNSHLYSFILKVECFLLLGNYFVNVFWVDVWLHCLEVLEGRVSSRIFEKPQKSIKLLLPIRALLSKVASKVGQELSLVVPTIKLLLL